MRFPEIAIRVTDFHLDRDNLVLGNVDLMDTPNGLTIYSCVKTGRAGISSRGFGELRDADNGLRDVVPEDYQHIGFDCVTFPAVPAAHMSLVDQSAMATKELGSLSDHLRGLIEQAYESNPGSQILRELYSAVGKTARKRFNVQNALVSAMVAHRLHSGVTSLSSGRRRGIMSMANVGFTRADVIQNLRKVVSEYVARFFGFQASWDFSEKPVDTGHVGSTGRFLRWKTVFSLLGREKVVVFQEDVNGYLSVSVEGVVIISHFKMGRLKLADYEKVFRELVK
jgi:hypothetical protein